MFTSSFARPRLLSAALAFLMVAGVLVSTARSSAAAVAVNEVYSVPSSRAFPLAGRGFGHGRGMSQYGARARAEAGQSLSTILGFYYPGTAAGDIGNPSVRVILTNAGKE